MVRNLSITLLCIFQLFTYADILCQYQIEVDGNLKVVGKINIEESQNVIIGVDNALLLENVAQYNVLIGAGAGKGLKRGRNNTYVGTNAGFSNSYGSHNSLFGYGAGIFVGVGNTSTSSNSFFGTSSGFNTRNGSKNSFFGQDSGYRNEEGSNNSFFGFQAGYETFSGTDNTYIGSKADGFDSLAVSETVIGANAVGNGDSTVTLGAAGTKTVYMGSDGMAMIVSSSDINLKKNIKDSELGLEFVNALRPVSYHWKGKSNTTHQQLQHGLIAQEVKAALDDMDVEWQGWHHNKVTDRQGLSYASLTVPLIKAIQQLTLEKQIMVETANTHELMITELEQRIINLESKSVKSTKNLE